MLQFQGVQECTVFLIPKDAAIQAKNFNKSKFRREFHNVLRALVGPEAQPDDCLLESLVRKGVGLFKVQITGLWLDLC